MRPLSPQANFRMKKNLTLVLALLAGGALTDPARAAEAPHETPVPVAAADYVSAETIDGAGLVLDPLAEPDGASLRFSGTGPRGRFSLSGRENLAAYAAMLHAIAELGKMDREKMFGRAAGQAAKAPVEAAAKLVTDPAKTLSALPKGAMNFLKRTGRQIKENSRQIAEGSANSTAASDLIGLGSIKRQLAVSLGVDPYLPDETFQNALNETASAAYFGGIGVKALTMLVAPVAVSQVVTGLNISGNLAKKIVSSSAADLRASDREDLSSLGVPPDTIAALFANRWFTPASTTVLVDALKQLGTKKASRDSSPPVPGWRIARMRPTTGKLPPCSHVAWPRRDRWPALRCSMRCRWPFRSKTSWLFRCQPTSSGGPPPPMKFPKPCSRARELPPQGPNCGPMDNSPPWRPPPCENVATPSRRSIDTVPLAPVAGGR